METSFKEKQLCSKNFLLSDFIAKDEVFHLARVTITSRKDLSYHSHNYAELFWIESGEGIHHINGYNVHIRKDMMVMLRPQDKHNFTAKNSHLTLVNIAFPKSCLEHLKNRYFPNTNLYFWSDSILPFQVILSEDLIKRISARAEEAMLYKRSYLQLDSLLLFIFRMLTINESGINYANAPIWLATAIHNYHKVNFSYGGGTSFISLCERNADYVNRVVKKLYNKTLTEFLNDIKIKYAANQLILTNIPIKTVCHTCGFSSLAYFYKQFKMRYQISPSRYREIYQKIV